MAALQVIKRGSVTFEMYAKSLRVSTPHGTEIIFLGREPEISDVDQLLRLIEAGAMMYRKAMSRMTWESNGLTPEQRQLCGLSND